MTLDLGYALLALGTVGAVGGALYLVGELVYRWSDPERGPKR